MGVNCAARGSVPGGSGRTVTIGGQLGPRCRTTLPGCYAGLSDCRKSLWGVVCETPPGGLGFEKGGQCDGLGQPRVNTLGCQALFSLVVSVRGYEACGPGSNPERSNVGPLQLGARPFPGTAQFTQIGL